MQIDIYTNSKITAEWFSINCPLNKIKKNKLKEMSFSH